MIYLYLEAKKKEQNDKNEKLSIKIKKIPENSKLVE